MPSQVTEPKRIYRNDGACRGAIYKILVTEAQFASGSETIKDFQVREQWLLRDPHFFISVCHIVNHLTNLTIKPTITRLHRGEPNNPEPPPETLKRTHVVNRKQNYKRPFKSVPFYKVFYKFPNEHSMPTTNLRN